MDRNLDRLQELVTALNQSNSSNDKKETLARFPDCQNLLHVIYHPYKQFYVTSKNLKKRSELRSSSGYGMDILKPLLW
jgi:hypothetical protein